MLEIESDVENRRLIEIFHGVHMHLLPLQVIQQHTQNGTNGIHDQYFKPNNIHFLNFMPFPHKHVLGRVIVIPSLNISSMQKRA